MGSSSGIHIKVTLHKPELAIESALYKDVKNITVKR
jgi:hypothetical protein